MQQIKERGLAGNARPKEASKSSQKRMKLYLSLERIVMDAMAAQFPVDLPVVLIHDGFMSKHRLDVAVLEKAVLDKTGFAIRLSEMQLVGTGLVDDKIDVEDVIQNDAGEAEEEIKED
jgi:hypothetical protein